MNKPGTTSRVTFISPYLRRPLRPLDKVLSEREDRASDETPTAPSGQGGDVMGSATWSLPRKSAVGSE